MLDAAALSGFHINLERYGYGYLRPTDSSKLLETRDLVVILHGVRDDFYRTLLALARAFL